jgi:hypothetical protein
MQLTIQLDKDQHAHLRALAARLDMPPQLAAAYLLNAAVEALEGEAHFLWPLYLTQVGGATAAGVPELSVRA